MSEEKDSYITSVEFDKEDFEYISKLIEEAKVRSLKEFVEKCEEQSTTQNYAHTT